MGAGAGDQNSEGNKPIIKLAFLQAETARCRLERASLDSPCMDQKGWPEPSSQAAHPCPQLSTSTQVTCMHLLYIKVNWPSPELRGKQKNRFHPLQQIAEKTCRCHFAGQSQYQVLCSCWPSALSTGTRVGVRELRKLHSNYTQLEK